MLKVGDKFKFKGGINVFEIIGMYAGNNTYWVVDHTNNNTATYKASTLRDIVPVRIKWINLYTTSPSIYYDSEEEAKNARDMYGYIKTISVEL